MRKTLSKKQKIRRHNKLYARFYLPSHSCLLDELAPRVFTFIESSELWIARYRELQRTMSPEHWDCYRRTMLAERNAQIAAVLAEKHVFANAQRAGTSKSSPAKLCGPAGIHIIGNQ